LTDFSARVPLEHLRKLGAKMGCIKPIVGKYYDTEPGESIQVIAIGTRGIVVEYIDGRVELLNMKYWQSLKQNSRSSDQALQAV